MDHIGTVLHPGKPPAAPINLPQQPIVAPPSPIIETQTLIKETTIDTPETSPSTTELKKMILHMKDQLDAMLTMIEKGVRLPTLSTGDYEQTTSSKDREIIEGVFNGQEMIGEDGKTYTIPPNYASKSKLVEGDLLKVTKDQTGRHLFKQISKTDRKMVKGKLVHHVDDNKWQVLIDGRIYNVLTAAVTFHKGEDGAEVTLIIPENGESEWGAIENILT